MQRALCRLTFILKDAPCSGDLCKDQRRMAQKLMAAIGDMESSGMTVKQLDAQIGFKIFDGFCNCALRDRQGLCTCADRAMLRDGDKIPELSQSE